MNLSLRWKGLLLLSTDKFDFEQKSRQLRNPIKHENPNKGVWGPHDDHSHCTRDHLNNDDWKKKLVMFQSWERHPQIVYRTSPERPRTSQKIKPHSSQGQPYQKKQNLKNKSQLLQYPSVVLSACLSKCSGTDIRTNGRYWEIRMLLFYKDAALLWLRNAFRME